MPPPPPTAFLLLTLPNGTLTTPTATQSGTLALECVTVPLEAADTDVYLVLRMNALEAPVDPAQAVDYARSPAGVRTYIFRGADAQPLVLNFPAGGDDKAAEDFETFNGILAQYTELRGVPHPESEDVPPPFVGAQEDLRGHLVLVNEDTGEVVGAVDGKELAITEDPALREDGPVVVDISDEGAAREVFVRAVPPEEQDWITKSATIVSQAISSGTTLLLTAVTSASSYYIAHSAPAPAPSTAPPSSVLVFLTSPSTRKGLSSIHAVSGQAVQVSQRTVAVIDSMVRHAMGGRSKGKKAARSLAPSPAPSTGPRLSIEKPPLPPRSRSPSPVPPPTYSEKPPLPPRKSTGMPAPTASTSSSAPDEPALRTRDRLLLSADLILSTLDGATKRVLDTSSGAIGDVVGHRYGADAAASTALLTGAARNVALVYVDMRGIGRKALLRRAGKEFVKARVSGRKDKEAEGGGG